LTDAAIADNSDVSLQPRTGLVTVFTGDGKGKTTAAIGMVVRAAGYGLRVGIVFFFKGKMFSQGEVKALGSLSGVDICNFGVDNWVKKGDDNSAAAEQAQQALATSAKMIKSGLYDLVVMDEVNSAVDFGLIDVQDILDILHARPAEVDIILTGRNAHQKVIEASDITTEMKCVKHAFERGIKARQGIDY